MRPRPVSRGDRVQFVADAAGVQRGRAFNAATARQPWRRSRTRGSALELPDARPSMRPRPVSRGDSAVSSASDLTAVSLPFNAATARQPWRPTPMPALWQPLKELAFNAATARQPWRRRARSPPEPSRIVLRPSMRPRPVSRGDERRLGQAVTRAMPVPPSMRPRPVSRGDCERERRASGSGDARPSMRPRPVSRGDRASYMLV